MIQHKPRESSNELFDNFKAMPPLLKLVFVVHLFTLGRIISNLTKSSEIIHNYFSTGFPRNLPGVYFGISLLFQAVSIFILLKRSSSLLLVYILLSTIGIIVTAFNSYNIYYMLQANTKDAFLTISTISIVLQLLVVFYIYNQKEYFSKS